MQGPRARQTIREEKGHTSILSPPHPDPPPHPVFHLWPSVPFPLTSFCPPGPCSQGTLIVFPLWETSVTLLPSWLPQVCLSVCVFCHAPSPCNLACVLEPCPHLIRNMRDTGFVLNSAGKANHRPSLETGHSREWVSGWGIRASDLGLLLWPALENTRLGRKLATSAPRPEPEPHRLVFLVRRGWWVDFTKKLFLLPGAR